LSPGERWSHHASNLLVGGTGVVYGAMRYFMEPSDPFSVVNHPWQPHFQHLHVLVAPLLVFVVGWSWQRHIRPRLRRRDMARYTTGISLVFSLVPMIASGYLLQTTVDPTWHKVWVGVHLAASGLWLLGYLIHQLQSANGKKAGKGLKAREAAPLTEGIP
jgi:hypothetical protein